MKSALINSLRQRSVMVLASVAFLATLGGCATTGQTTSQIPPPPPALSVGDISKMVTDKRVDAEIVRDIQSRGLKSQLNANDLDLLQKAGASKEVIDAALLARVPPTVVQQTVVAPVYPYGVGWGSPWGSPYPYYGGFGYGLSLGYTWGRPNYYYAPRFRGSVGVRAIR